MRRKNILLCIPMLAAIGMAGFTGCGKEVNLKSSQAEEKTFEEVSVHDPSIIEGEDGSYYIFGSHLAVARTDDLMNWTYVNRGVKNDNTVIPNVLDTMKEAFEWSQSKTFWAPDVVRLKNGTYAMYYCNCKGDEPLSCLGLATADTIEGPYTNQGILLKSGMDAGLVDEDGNLYQSTVDPNVVDPDTFYDQQGRLWMLYGSYSGGIFIKEMDTETGTPLESGYGTKLLGGNHQRIEGPYIIYNPHTEYYYLFLSYGGLDADGGYNIRVCRSRNPDGPYEDSMGQSMLESKGPANTMFNDASAEVYGTKLMGNYKFLWEEGEEGEDRQGYLSPGHNSCLYKADTDQYFIIYHTRFENEGDEHEVRVHQMFFNQDGWPVVTPYRYTGETLEPVDDENISGTYKYINHGRKITADITESENIELKSNGKIDGAAEGTWERVGESGISLCIDEDTYTGVVLKQWDEDGKKYVTAFTALCSDTGVSIWGSGLNAIEE